MTREEIAKLLPPRPQCPPEYTQGFCSALTLKGLRKFLKPWKAVAGDAWAIARHMTDGEFHGIWRQVNVAGVIPTAYFPLFYPEVLTTLTGMAAEQMVPWQLMYQRLIELELLEVGKDGIARFTAKVDAD